MKTPGLYRPSNADKNGPDRPSLLRPPLGGERNEALAAQLVDHHNEQVKALGDISGALQAMAPQVIGQITAVLDANGTANVQYRVPFASLFVDSFSAAVLTVAAAPLQSAAPNAGPGVALIRVGGYAVVNLRAYQWSIYGGAAGERVTVTAYSRPQPPLAGH